MCLIFQRLHWSLGSLKTLRKDFEHLQGPASLHSLIPLLKNINFSNKYLSQHNGFNVRPHEKLINVLGSAKQKLEIARDGNKRLETRFNVHTAAEA